MRVWVFSLLLFPLLAVGAYADLLGTASNFAVLGGSATTNTHSTTITGDYGVWSGTSLAMTGITLTGASAAHNSDAVAKQAQADLTTAYLGLNALVPTVNYSVPKDLGGLTLTPGVYKFDSSAAVTGMLILDAGGISNALFVFQIGSTLTTASSAGVTINNPGLNDAVYWVVGSEATIGTGTQFEGNILSLAGIALQTGATIGCGRALNQTPGPVTMDTNTKSIGCGTNESSSNGLSGVGGGGQVLSFDTYGNVVGSGNVLVVAAVPEPSAWVLLGSIIAVLAAQRRWARAKV